MTKTLLIALSCFASLAQANCLSETQLANLTDKETRHLIENVPPAFAHGLADKNIQLSMTNAQKGTCSALVTVTLPEEDIAEANAILDAQPAKKIMLAAQGQGVSQSAQSTAVFEVNAKTLTIAAPDQLQTADFGKLRASIELMYALITQKRAEITSGQTNEMEWTKEDIEKVTSTCDEKLSADACQCMANEYAKSISPRQMDYIQYIRTNPYALATGVNQAFEQLKEAAEQQCKE